LVAAHPANWCTLRQERSRAMLIRNRRVCTMKTFKNIPRTNSRCLNNCLPCDGLIRRLTMTTTSDAAIVLVSHSSKLASGLQELIQSMARDVTVRTAAGDGEGGLGTQ